MGGAHAERTGGGNGRQRAGDSHGCTSPELNRCVPGRPARFVDQSALWVGRCGSGWILHLRNGVNFGLRVCSERADFACLHM